MTLLEVLESIFDTSSVVVTVNGWSTRLKAPSHAIEDIKKSKVMDGQALLERKAMVSAKDGYIEVIVITEECNAD